MLDSTAILDLMYTNFFPLYHNPNTGYNTLKTLLDNILLNNIKDGREYNFGHIRSFCAISTTKRHENRQEQMKFIST